MSKFYYQVGEGNVMMLKTLNDARTHYRNSLKYYGENFNKIFHFDGNTPYIKRTNIATGEQKHFKMNP